MCKELLILGVIVSFLRIFTKAVYTQDVYGLQKSANLYFAVSIVIMFICMVFYNLAHKLPIMKYYDEVKIQAVAAEEDNGPLTGFVWRSAVWDTVGTIKWYGFGIMIIFVVTLAIFPVYLLENAKIATGSCIARLLFFPLFLGYLHGPKFFRTEIPVIILTCILGLTNGYLTSVLVILAPKTVKLQHAETAGIVSVLFLVVGLAAGSIIT
ncbi:hypothetical protein TSUD_227590 [Trifolium subterraneum]|uniref:Uncharacterized protein n=1 Tax=Trifolium subterraneum TaxID=3900 RepID=A0A2Z6LXU2_TRISU|nr:hypothetical protein TSUD_227590 [Trifolium subterraneum]